MCRDNPNRKIVHGSQRSTAYFFRSLPIRNLPQVRLTEKESRPFGSPDMWVRTGLLEYRSCRSVRHIRLSMIHRSRIAASVFSGQFDRSDCNTNMAMRRRSRRGDGNVRQWILDIAQTSTRGVGLQETKANLEQHACSVRDLFHPQGPMGVGLWLSAETARDLLEGSELPAFQNWLQQRSLLPFTLNGFPFGDFHQPVVKHLVYQPTWMEEDRYTYTDHLISILHALLPSGKRGSISTLPIAWGEPSLADEQWQLAAKNLQRTAERLRQLEAETGRWIQIAIEPEPGCAIQFSSQMVDFFERYLLPGADEDSIRRYITACHDVCHAAVMFEEQREVFDRFAAAGIDIGKVQVSAAVALPFAEMEPNERQAAFEQLQQFAEDRYLHQTVVRGANGDQFYQDLDLALASMSDPGTSKDEWRVHFHVPVYLTRFGNLRATQREIIECLSAAHATMPHLTHFEVETYAWGVLPTELQQPSLAHGIAEELKWFRSVT